MATATKIVKATEKKTEIKKIIIEVEGQQLTVTYEGAKKLKQVLDNLFEEKIVEKVKIVEIEKDSKPFNPWPPKPFIPEKPWKDDYPYKPLWCYEDNKFLCNDGKIKFVPSKHTITCCIDE